jgi:hypothetical protein
MHQLNDNLCPQDLHRLYSTDSVCKIFSQPGQSLLGPAVALASIITQYLPRSRRERTSQSGLVCDPRAPSILPRLWEHSGGLPSEDGRGQGMVRVQTTPHDYPADAQNSTFALVASDFSRTPITMATRTRLLLHHDETYSSHAD